MPHELDDDNTQLSKEERKSFLNQIADIDHQIVACSALGRALTTQEYIVEIEKALMQVDNGNVISHDDLKKEMETW